MMQVVINGQPHEVPESLSVDALVDHLGLAGQPLLIELNGLALFKSDWTEKTVQAGDRLEFIRIVAGG